VEALEDRLVPAAPTVVTDAATAVATTQATLNGTVNPQDSTVTALFQFSTDPAFTPTLAANIGSGFNQVHGVAVDAAGDVYVADSGNNAVKKVLPNGTIVTLPSGSGFNFPTGVAVDATGNVFVADSDNNAVKEILLDGTVRTRGSGFRTPKAVAVDAAGNVFVADFGNGAIKKVLSDDTTVTLASGLGHVLGVAVDAAGNVFVANVANAVKEILPDSTILTLGSGFRNPTGVAVDAAGNVFVADSSNDRVVELSPPAVAATPSPLSGSDPTAVSATLTGLPPGTTYYYRVVASGPGGTAADSSAQSFTTQIPTSFANLTGGSITFGADSVNLSGQLAATPSTPFPTGSEVTVSVNGVPETAALNPDGSFQLSYQFSQALNNFPPVAPSPSAITYAFADPSGIFAPASDSSQSLTVSQAVSTVSVADAGGTYNRGAFAATPTVAGVIAGVDDTPAATLEGVAPALSYYSGTYTSPDQLAGLTPLAGAPVNVGSYTVLASFPGSTDYSGGQALANFTIAQATPSITWADPAAITAGTPLGATQLNATAAVPGTFAYTPDVGAFLDAGSHTLSVTFTPDDKDNVESGSASVPLTVDKASPTFSDLLSPTIVYGMTTTTLSGHLAADSIRPPQGALVSVTLNGVTQQATLDGSGNFSTTFDTAALSAAGSPYTVAYASAGDDNFNGATASSTLTVSKASPSITWDTPAGIVYGTPLGGTQLDASASAVVNGSTVSVPGTFSYTLADGTTPADGAVLPAGANQTLLVSFTPEDDSNFSGASAGTTINVAQATPSITWADPAAITAGTLLSATQLNATADLPGTFAYTPDVGTVLDAGSHTLELTFTPDDQANYESVRASVPLRVDRAPLGGGGGAAPSSAAGPVFPAGDSGLGHGATQPSSVPGSPTLTSSDTAASVPGTLSVTPTAPSVLAVRLNHGRRPRGRGRSLSVVFSTLVQLDAGAFRLWRGRQALRLQVLAQAADGRTVATLAFRGPRLRGGVQPGGTYRLAIAADRVRADGLTLAGDSVFVLRRRGEAAGVG
jgi:NHL repeat